MQTKNKKHTEEYEAEVVRKLRGIEDARAERELKESQALQTVLKVAS